MKVLFNEIKLPFKKLGVFNEGSSFKLGYGMKDSDTLLKYMYYDKFPIGLKRKADYISKIPIYQKHAYYSKNNNLQITMLNKLEI